MRQAKEFFMYIGSKVSVLRAYLKHNIPANMWYATSNNGIVQVVHARFAEMAINKERRDLRPGHHVSHFNIWHKSWLLGEAMHFTDREEIQKTWREANGVVGNLAEFKRFKDHFVVLEQKYFYIPSQEELKGGARRVCGEIRKPEDFQQVLDLAREIVQASETEFR